MDLVGIDRFHHRCERRAPARKQHRQLADPGAGAGTAFAAGPGEPQGQRDYAILALLLGCGLRRTELLSEVKVGAIAQRENRLVPVNITGKGNQVRSVAVPAWVKAAIDA